MRRLVPTTRPIERLLITSAAVLAALAASEALGETVTPQETSLQGRANALELDAETSEALIRTSLVKSGLGESRADRIVVALAGARKSLGRSSEAATRRAGLQLRERLDCADYDWLLFAGGVSNRVVVRSTAERQPGGLQPGDVILEYGGRRIFRVSDFKHFSRGTVPGQTARLVIERDGRRLALLVANPLAIAVAPERREP
jgi:hypothetical protein